MNENDFCKIEVYQCRNSGTVRIKLMKAEET
jgi:hypothetical protein